MGNVSVLGIFVTWIKGGITGTPTTTVALAISTALKPFAHPVRNDRVGMRL